MDNPALLQLQAACNVGHKGVSTDALMIILCRYDYTQALI